MTNKDNLETKINLIAGAWRFGKKLFHYNPIFRGTCYFGAFVIPSFTMSAIILSPNKQTQQQIFYSQSFQKYDLNNDGVLNSTEFYKVYKEKK